MLDVNKIVMEYKLKLRAISKPGDDLWEVTEPIDDVNVMSLFSETNDGEFLFEVAICNIDNRVYTKEYISFDDCGEWEFRASDKFTRI